jgi:hypothetical protein
MLEKSNQSKLFKGRWRIVSMSAWDSDFIDEEGDGHFEFNGSDGGEFHFGCVDGEMDCRTRTRDGETAIEWTWDGSNEMEPAHGRGWAVIKGENLHGMIFFHGGAESDFVAKRTRNSRK